MVERTAQEAKKMVGNYKIIFGNLLHKLHTMDVDSFLFWMRYNTFNVKLKENAVSYTTASVGSI